MRQARERGDRGAAAVEFALVLPLLMLLTLGAIDWGYYFWVEHVVTNAAREGARAGTLHEEDAGALADAETTARDCITRGGLVAARVVTDVQLLTHSADVRAVRVRITYPTGSVTGFTSVVVPDAAHATSEMRR